MPAGPKTIGFLTEDFSALDVSWDNSLLFGAEFRRRGHRVLFASWRTMCLANEGLTAIFHESAYVGSGDPLAQFTDPRPLDFRELDLCLLRMDPPVDSRYLVATHMLDRAGTLVLNDPVAIRSYNEKLAIFSYPGGISVSRVVMSEESAMDALRGAPDVRQWIAKPTNAFGGMGVVKFAADDPEQAKGLMRRSSEDWREPLMLQEFNERVREGDKRIFLLEGEPIGWVNRIPREGQYLANIHAGAVTVPFELSEADRAACRHVADTFPKDRLPLICIDIIGDHLSEINVTCPSGLIQINRAMDRRCELPIIDYFERRIRMPRR